MDTTTMVIRGNKNGIVIDPILLSYSRPIFYSDTTTFIQAYHDKALSCLQSIPEEVFRRGIERME